MLAEGAVAFSKTVRNPVQQPAVLPRTGSQAGLAEDEKTPVLQGDASVCDHLRDGQVTPAGIEPATYGLGRRVLTQARMALSSLVTYPEILYHSE